MNLHNIFSKLVKEDAWHDGTNAWTSEHDQWANEDAQVVPALTGVDEAKGLNTKVRIVKGPKSCVGKIGWVVEVRHGAYKGAPKTFTVDYDEGGRIASVQLPGDALRVVKDEVEEDLPPPENAQRTQIPGTLPTYKKARAHLDTHSPTGKTIDIGSGLGLGAAELGADSYEPYPKKDVKPTFTDFSAIPDAAYHRVTNFNVLNVVPPELRKNIVQNIGRILAPGGVALITTRGKDVMSAAKNGKPGPEPMSVITSAGTYQKGFTTKELMGYVQEVLGNGYEVKPLKLGPAGVSVKRLTNVSEDAEQLNIGDPVIITGKGIEFEGATGEIADFGRDKRFVVINLYNHGTHSFHSSDVSYNDYADSDEEEAHAYDNDSQARDWMHGQELDEHIVKVKGGYELKSKKTGKNLGKYPTRAGAEKRERQVQYFKHAGESVETDEDYASMGIGGMGGGGVVGEGAETECPRCHSTDIKTYSDGEKECHHCHKTWDVHGVAEGTDSNLSYQGNCTEDDVIEHIFGDVNNFANMVEEHGDEFTVGDLVVKYDPETDIHSFYYKKQGVAESFPYDVDHMNGRRGINLPTVDNRDLLEKPYTRYGNYEKWLSDIKRINDELLDGNAEFTNSDRSILVTINGHRVSVWSKINGNGDIDIGAAKKYGKQPKSQGVAEGFNLNNKSTSNTNSSPEFRGVNIPGNMKHPDWNEPTWSFQEVADKLGISTSELNGYVAMLPGFPNKSEGLKSKYGSKAYFPRSAIKRWVNATNIRDIIKSKKGVAEGNYWYGPDSNNSRYIGTGAPYRGVGGARGREDDEGWENEREREQQERNTTYYILINGKVLKKDGIPYQFRGKEAASAAGRKMMEKEWNKGKSFHLSTSPEDKPDLVAKPQTAPAAPAQPAAQGKVFTFFDVGRGGKSFSDAQLQQMGLRQTKSGKWFAPTDNPTTIGKLEQLLNVKGKTWTPPVKEDAPNNKSVTVTTIKGRTYNGTLAHENENSVVINVKGTGGNAHNPGTGEENHVVAIKRSHIKSMSFNETSNDFMAADSTSPVGGNVDESDPCWKGYKQLGMKEKNGKQVPNCVPTKESYYAKLQQERDLKEHKKAYSMLGELAKILEDK